MRRLMELPGDPLWSHILGVLLGQADGQVFVSTQAVVACERFALEIEADLTRDGWFVRLVPASATCACSCHDVIQPGLVPCPNCDHSSRYARPDDA